MCDVLICKCCHTCTFSLLLSLLLWFFWVFLLSVVFLDIFHFLCCLVLPLNPLWTITGVYMFLINFFPAFLLLSHHIFIDISFFIPFFSKIMIQHQAMKWHQKCIGAMELTPSNERAPTVHRCHGATDNQPEMVKTKKTVIYIFSYQL